VATQTNASTSWCRRRIIKANRSRVRPWRIKARHDTALPVLPAAMP
jgi:hypothetical protein